MTLNAENNADVLKGGRWLRSTVVVLTGMLVASVTLNVVLAHRVRKVVITQNTTFADRLLKVGTAVPPIAAKRLDGQEEVISYAGTNQPTVLYIFTPPCSWCARNMDNFKTLVALKGSEYRFIGLSLTDRNLVDYVAKNELRVPVYTGLSAETLKAYGLGGTPQTTVLDQHVDSEIVDR